jgi:apolipoprotein N-acyltransferase
MRLSVFKFNINLKSKLVYLVTSYFWYLVSGLLLSGASLVPETSRSAVGAVFSIIVLTTVSRICGIKKSKWFFLGVVFHLVAFYWLMQTIETFGGFPQWIAFLLFLLFVLTAALQFVLVAWLFLKINRGLLQKLMLSLPIAWVIPELIFPRLFPWQLGHLFISCKPLASLAEYGGVAVISFIVVWFAEVVAELFLARAFCLPFRRLGVVSFAIIFIVCCVFGGIRNNQIKQRMENSQSVRVALVQGNLSLKEKGNAGFFEANLEKYQKISIEAVAQKADVVIWPESVVNNFLPEDFVNLRETQLASLLKIDSPLLFGALGYRKRSKLELQALKNKFSKLNAYQFEKEFLYHRFNSAFLIDKDLNNLGSYHKRVLMPFGEYLPFSETFPWIKSISPQSGDFSSGDRLEPVILKRQNSNDLKIGVLICYEDLVPRLSKSYAQQGANLLVNLTNDAWYGDTAAPHQHHLLALWRAIETRKYLLRVTNTGLTAVVDPLGNTIEKLPVFGEGLLTADVKLMEVH